MAKTRFTNPIPIREGLTKASAADIIDRIRTKWPDFDGVAINCPKHGRVELRARSDFARRTNMNCPVCESERCSPPTVEQMREKLKSVHPDLDWPTPSWSVNLGRSRMVWAHCPTHGLAWIAPLQYHAKGSHRCPVCHPSRGRLPKLYASNVYPLRDVPGRFTVHDFPASPEGTDDDPEMP